MKKTNFIFLLMCLVQPLTGFSNIEEDFKIESLNRSMYKTKPDEVRPKSLSYGEYKTGGICNNEHFSVTFPSNIKDYSIETRIDGCFYTVEVEKRFWTIEKEINFDLEYASKDGHELIDYNITTWKGMPALQYSYKFTGSSGNEYLSQRFKVFSEKNVFEVNSFCGTDENPSHFNKIKNSLVIY